MWIFILNLRLFIIIFYVCKDFCNLYGFFRMIFFDYDNILWISKVGIIIFVYKVGNWSLGYILRLKKNWYGL